MSTRRSFLTVAALAAVAFIGTAMAGPATKPSKVKIGAPAPEFTLKDASGKSYSLSDYKGKIVVLQWINPKCPVCYRVTAKGNVKQMRTELTELDPNVVHLAINSTHFMTAKDSAAYMKEHKLDVPALDDHEGTVGKLYGARTTPHMFVIDQNGILRYDGAIDDDNSRGSKGDDASNYVVATVTSIVNGETVAPDKTTPYGCSVKYKK